MNDPLIFVANAVIDAIWWPVMIGGPIMMALIIAGGIVHMRVMDAMMNSHLRTLPQPPFPAPQKIDE